MNINPNRQRTRMSPRGSEHIQVQAILRLKGEVLSVRLHTSGSKLAGVERSGKGSGRRRRSEARKRHLRVWNSSKSSIASSLSVLCPRVFNPLDGSCTRRLYHDRCDASLAHLSQRGQKKNTD